MEKLILKLINLYIYNQVIILINNIEIKLGKLNIIKDIDSFNINIKVSDIVLEMNLNKLKCDPINYIKSCSQSELENLLLKLNNEYYNNTSLISDEIYDILVDYIKENYKFKSINDIGAKVFKKKIKLPVHLPSMDKIKADSNALLNWLEDYPGNKIISDKLDGMSLLIDLREKIPRAYTRGDGSIGQDISWIIKYINIGNLNNNMVRGECIVSKSNWKILKNKYPEYSNPRNFVSGYTGRKIISEDLMKFIDFIAYEYITDVPLSLEQQLIILRNSKMNVVNYKLCNTISNEILSSILENRREHGEYDIDGIIITDNKVHMRETSNKYPKYAKAFKMILQDQIAEVLVTGISWDPSMYGILNPIVNLTKVRLDGVNISNASGYNANFIINNKIGGLIGPGTIVKLTRSGGVIPKIIKVIKPYSGKVEDILPKQQQFKDGYKWTNTKIDLILNNPDMNHTVKLKRIVHFFETLGVPYFKEGMITKVYEAGFNTISKILKISKIDLLKLEGFKEKSADKIINEINKFYKKARLLDLMSGHYGFGSGFGKKKIEPILLKYPDIMNYNLEKNKNILIKGIIEINGYQEKTAKKFVEGLEQFRIFYNEMPKQDNDILINTIVNPKGSKYINKVFCTSGFTFNKDLTDIIISNGGKIEQTIKSNVTDLIIKDENKLSAKILKAKEKGINIIHYSKFI
mgnify:CR=1 FL=1